LTPNDRVEIIGAFGAADYGWIAFSLVFAILSHLSRAYRWKYTLKPLGYTPKFLNSFFAVMIAYLVNLAVPRLGELTRCGVMARYEKIPFEKGLGTVVAERLADLIILLSITTVVVFVQIEVIGGMVQDILDAILAKFSLGLVLALGGAILLGGIFLLVLFFNKSFQNPILIRVREFVFGLFEGIRSIWTMKQKWAFLGHTVFIWLMYLVMFYVCFFSLPATSDVPIGGVLTAFVLGGFTIVLTNGGIGAYPLAIQAVLLLYDVDKNIGGAFGWIVWAAQTVLLLVLGAMSFALMPTFNRRSEVATDAT
jgi:uncharacterized protein (TIRG00374 family)